jgi:hypothetical protein
VLVHTPYLRPGLKTLNSTSLLKKHSRLRTFRIVITFWTGRFMVLQAMGGFSVLLNRPIGRLMSKDSTWQEDLLTLVLACRWYSCLGG